MKHVEQLQEISRFRLYVANRGEKCAAQALSAASVKVARYDRRSGMSGALHLTSTERRAMVAVQRVFGHDMLIIGKMLQSSVNTCIHISKSS